MGSSTFINKQIRIYYLVSVDHKSMVVHLTRSDVYPVQWMELVICHGMSVKRTGMSRVSVKETKAATVKVETMTLIGKGR